MPTLWLPLACNVQSIRRINGDLTRLWGGQSATDSWVLLGNRRDRLASLGFMTAVTE